MYYDEVAHAETVPCSKALGLQQTIPTLIIRQAITWKEKKQQKTLNCKKIKSKHINIHQKKPTQLH